MTLLVSATTECNPMGVDKKLSYLLTVNVAIICTALTKEWMIFFLQRLNLFSNLNSIFYFRTKDQNMLYRNQTYHSYTRSMLVNLMEDISKESEDVCELGIVSKILAILHIITICFQRLIQLIPNNTNLIKSIILLKLFLISKRCWQGLCTHITHQKYQ